MKSSKFFSVVLGAVLVFSWTVARAGGQTYSSDGEDPNKKIIKNGLLGAATGAIASSASGGKAGKGALIGAGTNVIGGALLDSLTSSPAPAQQARPVQYVQQAPPQYTQQQYVQQQSYPVQPVQTQYVEPQPVYVQQQPMYYQQPPQENANQKILKQGLLGAGVGAISAGASGGNAGKGALIGAGTNVIGGALLDSLTSSPQPQPQPVYYQPAPQPVYNQNQGYYPSSNSSTQPKKKIIRKYDSDGKVISEEEVWE